jgi:beta-glucanase (GH16 family)
MMAEIMKRPLQLIAFLIFFGALPAITGCKEDNGSGFTADFSFELIEGNRVKFINLSEGEYYSMQWEFGNGETLTTTDKNKPVEMYYPQAGDYQVVLKVQNYTGEIQTTTKTVNIAQSDLVLSFTAQINPMKPNSVQLVNTSIGNFSSFLWKYRNRIIENKTQAEAYFPFSGQYTIELQVIKSGETFSKTQTITIAQDDPDYASNLLLTWSDEFTGNSVNTNNWTFETGSSGWGNNELQNYTNGSNSEVKDGKLIITARKVNDNKVAGSYTSSRMITRNKKEFTYGRMEIRAKLPSGTGIWPAIWMLGSNIGSVGWPACGEIDIMEYVGYQPNKVHSTIHTPSSYGNSVNGKTMDLETAEEQFHNYGMIWTEKYIRFYIDDVSNVTYTYAPSIKNDSTWPFDKPFFLLLNIAVGGTWGGAQGIDNAIFPQTMEVEYVRVYQEPGS